MPYQKGDAVQIISGPYKSWVGYALEDAREWQAEIAIRLANPDNEGNELTAIWNLNEVRNIELSK